MCIYLFRRKLGMFTKGYGKLVEKRMLLANQRKPWPRRCCIFSQCKNIQFGLLGSLGIKCLYLVCASWAKLLVCHNKIALHRTIELINSLALKPLLIVFWALVKIINAEERSTSTIQIILLLYLMFLWSSSQMLQFLIDLVFSYWSKS